MIGNSYTFTTDNIINFEDCLPSGHARFYQNHRYPADTVYHYQQMGQITLQNIATRIVYTPYSSTVLPSRSIYPCA